MSTIETHKEQFDHGFGHGLNLVTPSYPYSKEYMEGYHTGAQMAQTQALITITTSLAAVTTMMEHMGTYQTAPPGSFVVRA